jgi:hypothetical protein
MNSRACFTNRLRIRGKRFFMGGTHPRMFTALDVPTVFFARKRLRFVSYSHLLKESNSLVFAPGHFCPQPNTGPANDGKYATVSTGVLGISIAKTESLGKFFLVFIKVDQVSVILSILVMNPEQCEMHRNDDDNRAHDMPHTGF